MSCYFLIIWLGFKSNSGTILTIPLDTNSEKTFSRINKKLESKTASFYTYNQYTVINRCGNVED